MESSKKISDFVFSKKGKLKLLKSPTGFLRMSDFAKMLGVSYKTIWRWINVYMILPAVKVANKWLIPAYSINGLRGV